MNNELNEHNMTVDIVLIIIFLLIFQLVERNIFRCKYRFVTRDSLSLGLSFQIVVLVLFAL